MVTQDIFKTPKNAPKHSKMSGDMQHVHFMNQLWVTNFIESLNFHLHVVGDANLDAQKGLRCPQNTCNDVKNDKM